MGEALGGALRRSAAASGAGPAAGPAAVIGLAGPPGSGKTSFVQGLARGLGVRGAVRSPTFTLIHEHGGPVPLSHVDLYRLEASDLEGLGLEEILDAGGVVAIEWADRAPEVLPPDHLLIAFGFGSGESDRCLRFIPGGPLSERWVAAVRACASSR